MTVPQSILTAVFMMIFVFLLLALLCVFIKAMAALLNGINQQLAAKTSTAKPEAQPVAIQADENSAYGGTLRLQDVDEPTAAMIMAIVSDTSGIPLSQLCFKSIKAIPNPTNQGSQT